MSEFRNREPKLPKFGGGDQLERLKKIKEYVGAETDEWNLDPDNPEQLLIKNPVGRLWVLIPLLENYGEIEDGTEDSRTYEYDSRSNGKRMRVSQKGSSVLFQSKVEVGDATMTKHVALATESSVSRDKFVAFIVNEAAVSIIKDIHIPEEAMIRKELIRLESELHGSSAVD